MTERRLRYTLGLFILGLHFGLIGVAIVLYFIGGFSIDEFTTAIAVTGPVFAGYATSIIAFIIKDKNVVADDSKGVNSAYAGLAFVLPFILALLIALAMICKAWNRVFANFEDCKRFLLLLESLFAAYVGMFVYSLFDKVPAPAQNHQGGSPN